jgi:BirA family biotin operon repressor/biotin-[acetyl-CoA-carboxylase] ligase
VVRLKAVDSTNDHLRDLFLQGAVEGTVVVAERQSQGRGRHGRAWASPPGGLYLSLLIRPTPWEASRITLLLAVAAVRALAPLGITARLKWPNDILVGGRKLGGILAEGVHSVGGYGLIVGVGLNTNIAVDDLPDEVQGRATSARVELGRKVDNEEVLLRLLSELDEVYRLLRSGGEDQLLREYCSFCETLGREVEVQGSRGRVRGLAVGIEPDGRLLVQDDGGRIHSVVEATVVHLGEG